MPPRPIAVAVRPNSSAIAQVGKSKTQENISLPLRAAGGDAVRPPRRLAVDPPPAPTPQRQTDPSQSEDQKQPTARLRRRRRRRERRFAGVDWRRQKEVRWL